jgi:hypothetical protein
MTKRKKQQTAKTPQGISLEQKIAWLKIVCVVGTLAITCLLLALFF